MTDPVAVNQKPGKIVNFLTSGKTTPREGQSPPESAGRGAHCSDFANQYKRCAKINDINI